MNANKHQISNISIKVKQFMQKKEIWEIFINDAGSSWNKNVWKEIPCLNDRGRKRNDLCCFYWMEYKVGMDGHLRIGLCRQTRKNHQNSNRKDRENFNQKSNNDVSNSADSSYLLSIWHKRVIYRKAVVLWQIFGQIKCDFVRWRRETTDQTREALVLK